MASAVLDDFLELGFLIDPLQVLGIPGGNVGVALAAVLAEVDAERVEGRSFERFGSPDPMAEKAGLEPVRQGTFARGVPGAALLEPRTTRQAIDAMKNKASPVWP
jgi:hypothetical protein